MRTHLRTLLVALTLAAGVAAAPTIYAHDDGAGGSTMGRGMMGERGMMGMMGGMMEHCNEMMQAMDDGHAHRPNEQWRDRQPAPQDHPRPQAPDR